MRQPFFRNLVLVAVGLALLLACKPTVPSQYIQPGEMEEILYDYLLTQAIAQDDRQTDGQDYRRTLYMDAVLEHHGVSQAEFDSSLVYYYTRAENFEAMYKHLSERLEKEALALGATEGEVNKYSMLSQTGDTANIWSENSRSLLLPVAPYNRLDFYIEADTTFKAGDNFSFNFLSNFLYQSGSRNAMAGIVAQYENDSIISQMSNVLSSGVTQLRIHSPSDLRVKSLRGFVYLSDNHERSTTLRLLFLTQLQLVRFHKKQDESVARLQPSPGDSLQPAPVAPGRQKPVLKVNN